MVELGEVQFPPEGNRIYTENDAAPANHMRACCIEVWSEQITAGNLTLTHLVLIPATHMIYFDGSVMQSGSADYQVVVQTAPTNEVAARGYNNTVPNTLTMFAERDWSLPLQSSCLVVAAQRAAVMTTTDTVQVIMAYRNRWQTYASPSGAT
jgi:hypothetical protein